MIIAFTGGSFVEALTQPGFWVVQEPPSCWSRWPCWHPTRTPAANRDLRWSGSQLGQGGPSPEPSPGALLAVATQTPVFDVLSNTAFLIPAGIAILVAILEAWPDDASD